jgi:hypothetical protein
MTNQITSYPAYYLEKSEKIDIAFSGNDPKIVSLLFTIQYVQDVAVL